ncbi:hypothetical protein Tsp_12033 [Trichinella spiralis]|uniref:hypothetical protein n=1 Tax=Trichinella spiralis TaxID=6334 RepID=UPI0001EFB85C|nr:hypothetical protein Tsp_12033 [Trichinella spiralis]
MSSPNLAVSRSWMAESMWLSAATAHWQRGGKVKYVRQSDLNRVALTSVTIIVNRNQIKCQHSLLKTKNNEPGIIKQYTQAKQTEGNLPSKQQIHNFLDKPQTLHAPPQYATVLSPHTQVLSHNYCSAHLHFTYFTIFSAIVAAAAYAMYAMHRSSDVYSVPQYSEKSAVDHVPRHRLPVVVVIQIVHLCTVFICEPPANISSLVPVSFC